ncbi:hypothetical protein B0H21DRAFT_855470 [Amylocystis lapponica]|nr:hypothetical protein B0H21DRAFT_855470 [Amylocystis lapponica]
MSISSRVPLDDAIAQDAANQDYCLSYGRRDNVSSLIGAGSVPQKRKEPPSEDDFPSGTFTLPDRQAAPDGTTSNIHPKGEYQTGRVICEACGEGISKHWDAHRLACPNSSSQQVPEAVVQSPETPIDPSQPQAKRRRAKRSEEERIEYLRSDPYVAQFEAYRVLCACCDKWIRLRPNSTYCSIPWDAHRKSCLAKRIAKNSYPADDRTSLFSTDPNVRKFDAERVLCRICENWVQLGSDDHNRAVKIWMEHRAACQQTTLNEPILSTAASNIPTIDSVPPPPKHLLALASSSSFPPPSVTVAATRFVGIKSASISAPPAAQPVSPSAFKDLNPSNFPPTHESRRRNAEQRAASLRADPLVGDVEPNRVFCSLCQKWVQLRQDSSYCAYPWLQHRGKCLNRHQRRTQQEAEISKLRAERDAAREAGLAISEDAADDSDEPESEEGVESGNEEEKQARREERREERRKAKAAAKLEFLAARLKQEEERKANGDYRKAHSSISQASDDDADALGDADMDVDMIYPQLADLHSPSGRLDYTFRSVRYLFRSTYEKTDELTIAALVTYLNAAMPPDKHEDFDTAEVTKAAVALHEQGEFVFEGDVLRVAH